MKSTRSAPIAFRFDPTTKAALALIAERDGRSMANMMEWLIRKHCEKEALGWPPAGVGPSAPPASRTPAKRSAKAAAEPSARLSAERKKN